MPKIRQIPLWQSVEATCTREYYQQSLGGPSVPPRRPLGPAPPQPRRVDNTEQWSSDLRKSDLMSDPWANRRKKCVHISDRYKQMEEEQKPRRNPRFFVPDVDGYDIGWRTGLPLAACVCAVLRHLKLTTIMPEPLVDVMHWHGSRREVEDPLGCAAITLASYIKDKDRLAAFGSSPDLLEVVENIKCVATSASPSWESIVSFLRHGVVIVALDSVPEPIPVVSTNLSALNGSQASKALSEVPESRAPLMRSMLMNDPLHYVVLQGIHRASRHLVFMDPQNGHQVYESEKLDKLRNSRGSALFIEIPTKKAVTRHSFV